VRNEIEYKEREVHLEKKTNSNRPQEVRDRIEKTRWHGGGEGRERRGIDQGKPSVGKELSS